MRYAFLGTRQPRRLPHAVIDLYQAAAVTLADRGDTILSGATSGADQLAAETALAVGGKVELFLPWALYEREWVQRMKYYFKDQVQETVFAPETHLHWLEAARATVPHGERLATGSIALHARYYGMLEQSEAAVVMPYARLTWEVVERPVPLRRSKIGGISCEATIREQIIDKGSSEPAIRFAEHLKRSAFDLSNEDDRFRLLSMLRQPASTDRDGVQLRREMMTFASRAS